jgi:hypothetical protein
MFVIDVLSVAGNDTYVNRGKGSNIYINLQTFGSISDFGLVTCDCLGIVQTGET